MRRDIEKQRDAAGDFLEEAYKDFRAARVLGAKQMAARAGLLLAETYALWKELDEEVEELVLEELHQERVQSAGLGVAL